MFFDDFSGFYEVFVEKWGIREFVGKNWGIPVGRGFLLKNLEVAVCLELQRGQDG